MAANTGPVAELQGNRIISLIDMDCFYVQVEELESPEFRGKPCGVRFHFISQIHSLSGNMNCSLSELNSVLGKWTLVSLYLKIKQNERD